MLKMWTIDGDFNYKQPEMEYDKETGDVTILENKPKKRKIIRNTDELAKEKDAVMKEAGLETGILGDEDVSTAEKQSEVAAKTVAALRKFQADYDVDPTTVYVFARDSMRVDVGLIVSRPPIFLHMRQRDAEFLKARSQIMSEYHCDMKKYIEEFEEVSKLNEHVLAANPYAAKQNRTNLDNYPTHAWKDPDSGETLEYAAASKAFVNVDPAAEDVRSLHYASEDRTYLILKNKYTDEWEFPTTTLCFGTSFLRAKQDLFVELSGNAWKIKYSGSMPQAHSIRDMTVAEQEDARNNGLKGVRTYYFNAHHWRGIPEMDFSNLPYEDFAWIPKRKLNEYLTESYHEVFINVLRTR